MLIPVTEMEKQLTDYSRTFFIPGNVPSSKNMFKFTRQGRKYPHPRVTQYKELVKPDMIHYQKHFRNVIEQLELTTPYFIAFQFVRESKHKFDYINPAQMIQDLMGEYEWISDDNADILNPIFIPYLYDKEHPGVFITPIQANNIASLFSK